MATEVKKEYKKRGPKPKTIPAPAMNEAKTKDPVSAPPKDESQFTVKIDRFSFAVLNWLGKGDLSTGIRKAAKFAFDSDWQRLFTIRDE